LMMLSFSISRDYLPDPSKLMRPFFELISKGAGKLISHSWKGEFDPSSDSINLYLNTLANFILALIICSFWMVLDKQKNKGKLFYWMTTTARYYLAFQLLIFGFNKLFKWQFYFPEPNILFTQVAELDKEMIYWTAMGYSRAYSVFTGSLELLAALLLLFRRTSFAGALLAIAVMTNVVAINFCFDISVKLFSMFLLLLSFISLSPNFNRIKSVLSGKSYGKVETQFPAFNFKLHILIKTILILLLFGEAIQPYISSGNYNDDESYKPPLYGAWKVITFVKNGDTIPPLLTETERWRKVFFNRSGYFIYQNMEDEMYDNDMDFNESKKQIDLISTDSTLSFFSYREHADSLFLDGYFRNDSVNIVLKEIDLNYLPANSHKLNSFHWTIDSYYDNFK
ncbi:MAG: hypothetical protein H7321_10520, partial [Bacteroidia bacterium]|nr:hypothetical protein [Bacteroidia bacterium]